MTIKVQCGCGTRYSFEVEPRDGVMPFRVNCPACNADGTEAANQIIAQTPRLHMQSVAVPAASVPRLPTSELLAGASIGECAR